MTESFPEMSDFYSVFSLVIIMWSM